MLETGDVSTALKETLQLTQANRINSDLYGLGPG